MTRATRIGPVALRILGAYRERGPLSNPEACHLTDVDGANMYAYTMRFERCGWIERPVPGRGSVCHITPDGIDVLDQSMAPKSYDGEAVVVPLVLAAMQGQRRVFPLSGVWA